MDYLILIGFVGACMAAASTGAMYPPGEWYRTLDKPQWTPPNWLFPLAWTVLYAAMAYAAWRVAISGADAASAGLAFWACQIACNAIWTPIFFGLKRLGAAFVAICALGGSVAVTLVLFLMSDLVAGLLLVPYLIWVSYAGALNYVIWQRNKAAVPA